MKLRITLRAPGDKPRTLTTPDLEPSEVVSMMLIVCRLLEQGLSVRVEAVPDNHKEG